MKEIIESITECNFSHQNGSWKRDYCGYVIQTNKQDVKIGITDYQSCCESFGYLTSEDDMSYYIGAELVNVTITDDLLVTTDLYEVREGATMFVNIVTNKGTLQFVVYNCHNGYYGHDALVISEQLTHSECL